MQVNRAARMLVIAGVAAVLLAGCSGTGTPDVSVRVGDGQASSGGGQMVLSLQLLVALTVLAIAPSILLLATSFTRIIVVLSLLRSALGIPNLPPNQILIGLSLFLTLFIMAPVWSRVNEEGLQPYLRNEITQEEAIARGFEPVRTFMLGQTREKDLSVFVEMSSKTRPANVDEVPTEVLLPAFVTSELKTAFTMGFMLFVPFVVIDLIVASALMSMGMVMVSPTQIALPFKLLLFIVVDGWMLLVQSVVRSFG